MKNSRAKMFSHLRIRQVEEKRQEGWQKFQVLNVYYSGTFQPVIKQQAKYTESSIFLYLFDMYTKYVPDAVRWFVRRWKLSLYWLKIIKGFVIIGLKSTWPGRYQIGKMSYSVMKNGLTWIASMVPLTSGTIYVQSRDIFQPVNKGVSWLWFDTIS